MRPRYSNSDLWWTAECFSFGGDPNASHCRFMLEDINRFWNIQNGRFFLVFGYTRIKNQIQYFAQSDIKYLCITSILYSVNTFSWISLLILQWKKKQGNLFYEWYWKFHWKFYFVILLGKKRVLYLFIKNIILFERKKKIFDPGQKWRTSFETILI